MVCEQSGIAAAFPAAVGLIFAAPHLFTTHAGRKPALVLSIANVMNAAPHVALYSTKWNLKIA